MQFIFEMVIDTLFEYIMFLMLILDMSYDYGFLFICLW